MSNSYDIFKASPDLSIKYERMMRLFDTEDIDLAMLVFSGNDYKKINRVQRDNADQIWFNMQGLGFYVAKVEEEETSEEQVEEESKDIVTAFPRLPLHLHQPPNIEGDLEDLEEPAIGEYGDFGQAIKNLEVGQMITSKDRRTTLIKVTDGRFKLLDNDGTFGYSLVQLQSNYFEDDWAVISIEITISEAMEKLGNSNSGVYIFIGDSVFDCYSSLNNFNLFDLYEARWFNRLLLDSDLEPDQEDQED